MSKYKRSQKASAETIDVAMTIAKGIQKPNQTKEQTKLIALGIQKGITEYKKQQKSKSRKLDKLKKNITPQQHNNTQKEPSDRNKCKTQWLPWTLLLFSWLIMAIYTMADIVKIT